MLRSDRLPAALLLVAAGSGLAVANSPLGSAVLAIENAVVGLPGVFALPVGGWITEGLLGLFFFAVAVELRFELTSGELRSTRRALVPAVAAGGGILVPVVVYLAMAACSGTAARTAAGWPVPTATDIAFALGVLAVFGRGLPSSLRVFLLALAILDDIVGIVFVAMLSADGLDLGVLALAALAVAAFGASSRLLDTRARALVAAAMAVLAPTTWVLISLSGVHPTIAGVALGLATAPRPALRIRHALQPWVNGLVLPLFAFTAALVVVPAVPAGRLSTAFWGVLIALPVGKLLGIALFGWLAQRLVLRDAASTRLAVGDLLAAGALGGIGFTVSLLLAGLAFEGAPALRDQATLGVLSGSTVSLTAAAILVSWRSWHHRRAAAPSTP